MRPSYVDKAREARLRVLLVVDETIRGGHVVQAHNTAAALRNAGVEVTVAATVAPNCSGYEILHSFGMDRDALRAARRSGMTVVITPIWWRYGDSIGWRTRRRDRWARTARLTASAARRGFDETARRIRRRDEESSLNFELADLLLPNSEGEAAQIRSDLGVTTPTQVCPERVRPGAVPP